MLPTCLKSLKGLATDFMFRSAHVAFLSVIFSLSHILFFSQAGAALSPVACQSSESWMDSDGWHAGAIHWVGKLYTLTVPQISGRGRMAAVVAFAIFFALIWLLIRAYLVIQIPNEVLVDKLGLDVPPSPEITLEEVHSEDVRISWKQQDLYNSLSGYAIHINGSNVGEAKRVETAASIYCLQPATYYDIRVFATSSTGFQTPSTILHVRTLPRCKQHDSRPKEDNLRPYIKAYSTRLTTPSSPMSPPAMARETSGGHSSARRLTAGKRNSAGSPSHAPDHTNSQQSEDSSGDFADEEPQSTLAQLQNQLEQVKRDIDLTEADVIKEDEEFAITHNELKQEKEVKATKLEERNEVSKHWKTQINQHEGKKSSLNKERSKKEALVAQKEREQKGKRDDIARWDEQSRDHQANMEQIEVERLAIIEDFDNQIQEAREKMKTEEIEVEAIGAANEETKHQLRIWSRKSHGGQVDDTNENDLRHQEHELSWQSKINEWIAAQSSLARDIAIARQQFEMANSKLIHLREVRLTENSGNYMSPIALNLDMARRDPLNRRARQRSSLTSNLSSPNPIPGVDSELYSSISTGSPTSLAAQFGFNNGSLSLYQDNVPIQDDVENFIGPVPTSPKEVDLLPKDLLQDNPADDDRMIVDKDSDERVSSPSSISKRLSGIGQSGMHGEGGVQDAISPVSSSSRPASIFASPRSSLYNLPESEARANLSKGVANDPSEYADTTQSTSRKLVSSLFSFNRQRGKTLADEPPLLGSLKPSQSQSFPRNLGDNVDDADLQRKRRSSHAGNRVSQMSAFFPRAGGADEKGDGPLPNRRGMATFFGSGKLNPVVLANLGRSSNQKDSLNPFSARSDSIDASIHSAFRAENSVSRTSSLRSFDNSQLPRPSSDNNALLLSLAEKSDYGTSPLGAADWATPWSRSASRRPSVQHGSSTNLPLGPQLEDAEVVQPSREKSRPRQAPIGTRPSSATQKVMPPKLNPTAAPFKTSFFRKSEKEKEKSLPKTGPPSAHEESNPSGSDDFSQSDARSSKDIKSITTVDLPIESPEPLERTVSGTAAESVTPKETLIQKLTRKGSSTKFNSWKSKDRGNRFLKKGENPSSIDLDEDTGSDGQLGRSVDSTASVPTPTEKDKSARSSLSFSFIKAGRRAEKKKTQDVSESSEVGESETGDESLVD